ncbi:ubiquinone biosynthesis protein Coq4 [Zopfochytrium polystomum]|nr:ubiquinone biosynthesis protein Coq4 [Zopfochytrium polystomum]
MRLSALVKDVGIATNAAFTAIRDPTRQDMVAALGETTGRLFLGRMRDRMLRDRVGRQILRNRPIINSTVLDLDRLRSLPDETFGKTYVSWLDSYKVSPDSRTEVKYIEDEELAYVMLRYRQVHDFFHTLTGLGTTVEEELALKWLEATQTGLPVAILSAVVGPLRLNGEERERLFGQLVPWAVQCGSNAQFLLNVDYEGMLERRLAEVQRDLGILPLPRLV